MITVFNVQNLNYKGLEAMINFNNIMETIKMVDSQNLDIGREIETEYGIPIVNKRISVTPISIIAQTCVDTNYVEFTKTLDKASETLRIDFISGFSALV